jgi:hypothetical protein
MDFKAPIFIKLNSGEWHNTWTSNSKFHHLRYIIKSVITEFCLMYERILQCLNTPNYTKYRSLFVSCGCWPFPMWPVEPFVTHNITIMLQHYYIMLFNILYYTILKLCVMLLYYIILYIITVCEA